MWNFLFSWSIALLWLSGTLVVIFMPCFLEPRQSCTNICYTKCCSTEKFSLSLSLSLSHSYYGGRSLSHYCGRDWKLNCLESLDHKSCSLILIFTYQHLVISSISPPLEGKRFETIIHLCLDHFFLLLFRQCHCHISPFFFFF